MTYTPPDRHHRSNKVEREINDAFRITFGSQAGATVLTYLKNISINEITPPDQLDRDFLMYREGMRFIVAIIDQRIQAGENRLPKPEDKE